MKDEEKEESIYGDSLKVERNDSLFFCTFALVNNRFTGNNIHSGSPAISWG